MVRRGEHLVSDFTRTTLVPLPCRICGKPEHGLLPCSSAPTYSTHLNEHKGSIAKLDIDESCPHCGKKKPLCP